MAHLNIKSDSKVVPLFAKSWWKTSSFRADGSGEVSCQRH